MTDRSKKLFLGLSIAVPFLLYCVYYYGMMISNAPFKFSEFESMDFKYGEGSKLDNQYDSKTGRYQYVNNHNLIVVKTVHLNKDDLLYLHRKAAELGFWDFPVEILADTSIKANKNTLRYVMAFHYKRKSKQVIYDVAYDENPKLRDAAAQMAKEIEQRLADAEDRTK